MDKKRQITTEMFHNLYGAESSQNIELMVTNLKSELENLPRVESFVTTRVKAPLSILQKYDTDEKYSKEWNSMKDLIGFTVVVDTNQDVDSVLYYMQEHYEQFKNPNSKYFYRDFRFEDCRQPQKRGENVELDAAKQPLLKGYQTNNGYKNVRINLMFNETVDGKPVSYPIEVQVKTKAQYVAHMATHDPVYKSKAIKDKDDCTRVSDALFPYFEALAHLMLKEDQMSERQIYQCKKDIKEIYERNEELYKEFPGVFNEASSIFAVYMFVLKNREKLYANALLDNSIINNQLLESEVLRIFHYKQKELLKNDKSLTESKAFMITINDIINMSYEEFVKLSNSIAGDYRKETCIIAGIFDMNREKDIKLIQRCAKSFRHVVVAVYDDELTKMYLGVEPMFSVEDRMKAVEMLDDVSSVTKVDITGKVHYAGGTIEPFIIDKPKPKKYAIGYLPGVFDMFHPGHIEYIQEVIKRCDKVIVGIKTDFYVLVNKNKTTVQKEDERVCVANALVGVSEVYKTPYDIMPPQEVLAEMEEAIADGKACAIFLGSDWKDPTKKKGPSSLAEYDVLTERYSGITLDCIPRGNSGRSSTKYRGRAIEAAKFNNPHELKTLGV